MGKPINILIVDDEPKNLTVLETVLDDPGYRLVRAGSADKALLALVDEEFALIILDIRMPGMTGFELAQMIKGRRKTARVPIIFLTAYYNEDQHVLEGYGTGAVDYLNKPVNPAILRSKVAVFAELHRAQRECGLVNRNLLTEVTERRRAEEQLRELNETLEKRVLERAEALRRSEGLYRAIGESIDYGIWTCDAAGRNTYASESFLKLVGLTQERCSNFGWGEVLHPDEAAATLAAWQECVRTGEKWDREHRFRGVDGQWHSVLARGVPVKDERGKIVSWAGINLDIRALKATEAAFRLSEEKYRGLIQSLPAAVYTCDQAGRIQLYNGAAVELWGREPKVGQDLWCGSWRIYHPDGTPLEPENCPMARTLKEGHSVRGEEIWVERPDGSRRHVLPYPDPIFDAAGKVTGAVNMLLDITERKRMETLLREAKVAAETANQSKDRFLAVLSHELRTPLTPVLMSVGMLEQDATLRPDVRGELAMIKESIELETKLIDDLLDVSRISSGKVVLNTGRVDLNNAVRQASVVCRPQLREQNVQLEMELCEGPVTVIADPARLQQVLWNVLKNAIKFSSANGKVYVSTMRVAPDRVEVRVRDEGVGIPPEMLSRIFDAFEQGDPAITRQFGGLGLGLAISKALMDLHGGSIRAESEGRGRGATFFIELGEERSATPATPVAAPQNGVPVPLRLLVVEDHANTARTLRILLNKSGYTVSIATGVRSALELAGRETFDLLITDLGLPDGTGYDVLAGLKKIQPLSGIAMSGYAMDDDLRRTREAGFLEHVTKPFEVPQLLAAITRAEQRISRNTATPA